MALIIAGATVATGMSDVTDVVLRSDNLIIPNLTCSDRFNMVAGQIQVSRYKGSGITAPKAPGSNFVGSDFANDVVTINCNNSFQKEVDVRGIVAATMPVDVLTDTVINVSEDVREDREATCLAVLTKGGTADTDTTVVTAENVKSLLIGSRKALRKKHAKPNIVFCSVDTYSAVLEANGKDFTPIKNDEIQLTGRIGSSMGMIFIEATRLDNFSTYSYIDAEGAEITQSIADVDYIMYDFNAFSVIDKLMAIRAINTEDFVGTKVQVDVTSGIKVTNANCVLVKKHVVG